MVLTWWYCAIIKFHKILFCIAKCVYHTIRELLQDYFDYKLHEKCKEFWGHKYLHDTIPTKDTLSKLFQRFCETSFTQDKQNTGRPKVVTLDFLQETRVILQSSQTSVTCLSYQIYRSCGSTHKALIALIFCLLSKNGTGAKATKQLYYCQWFLRFIYTNIKIFGYFSVLPVWRLERLVYLEE